MKRYQIGYTRIPTNYNQTRTALIDANSPEDARELLIQKLDETASGSCQFDIEKAYEYKRPKVEGTVVSI